jgi:hypothetical protein
VWRDWATAGVVAGLLAYLLLYSGAAPGWVAVLLCVVTVVVALLVGRIAIDWVRATPILNASVAVLFLFPIVQTTREQIAEQAPTARAGYSEPVPLSGSGEERPDIYYIIADGLGQPEVLSSLYGLGPEELLKRFDELGFWVAPGSRANYPQTALSLSATFNMDFVQNLLDIPDPQSDDRRPLSALVANNRIVNSLKRAGYRIVTYPTGYPLTRLADVDVERQPRLRLGFVEFHILRDSILPRAQRLFGRGPADLEFSIHRHRLRFIFRELPHAREGIATNERIFVFAHLLAPHPPFVFGRNGEALRSQARFSFRDGNHWRVEHPPGGTPYRELYRNQALYVIDRLADCVQQIIRTSTRPVVIIIQGDHGPGSQLTWDVVRSTNMAERHGIFNAWYLPQGIDVGPYPGISAVNTFRVVLNACFGADMPLLADRAWYARWIWPYAFTELRRGRTRPPEPADPE